MLGASFAEGSEQFECTVLHNGIFMRFCLTSLIVCCVCVNIALNNRERQDVNKK